LDRFDKATRSRVMSHVKSRGTKTTEWRFRSLLMRAGISGWKIGHDFGLPGSPDVLFPQTRIAVFVDGCFWHGCRRCRSIPLSNRAFWKAKIQKNTERDRRATRALANMGWKVIRIWEHDLKTNPKGVRRRVTECLNGRVSGCTE
jgi:DNA mismatch endonuclease (patch repair protein)